jgi:hypothetical protein
MIAADRVDHPTFRHVFPICATGADVRDVESNAVDASPGSLYA